MPARTALVIGGTGPTGPHVVEGLAERGYRVSVLHGGQHEVPFAVELAEHLHADPHFAESIGDVLGSRTYDLVVATYGRLRVITEFFRGRTGRLIGIGSATGTAAAETDPRWGRVGRPVNLREEWNIREDGSSGNTLSRKMAEAEVALLTADADGAYAGTYLGYSTIYGPRQPAPFDWCVVRRVLDGRTRMIVADGGIKIESRMYAENAAHAVLCAVDRPEAAAGASFYLADERQFTMRQRIEFIAAHLGRELELVDLPYELATPCHPFWRHERGHRFRDTGRLRSVLGYRDRVPAGEAMARTVDWVLRHRPEPGGEVERKLGDSFAYDVEDAIVAEAGRAFAACGAIEYPLPAEVHQYRHPSAPGERWSRPDEAVSR